MPANSDRNRRLNGSRALGALQHWENFTDENKIAIAEFVLARIRETKAQQAEEFEAQFDQWLRDNTNISPEEARRAIAVAEAVG
jgi:hypothetical protein